MGLSLDKIIFIPSGAEGSTIGSHILAGDDGTAIGHVSDALKVNLSNASIAVTATDLDIRNLVFATDKVDASGSTLGANSGVDIGDVTINNASGASAVNVQDGGNSLTVDAVDLDIRNLVFATDKVDVSGSSVSFTPSGASSAAYGATSVSSTATKIIATNLASRLSVIVENLGTKDMFFGHNNSVTTSNGIRVASGQSLELAWGPSLDLYGITASGTADVRYLESA